MVWSDISLPDLAIPIGWKKKTQQDARRLRRANPGRAMVAALLALARQDDIS
jgi:hypothetical protein